jgi:hypothetical protein
MKLQCACGAKYVFEVTPDMLCNPVKFVCQSCGLDSSDFVNELIRRELAEQTPSATATPAPPSAPQQSPRLKISHSQPPAAQPQPAEAKKIRAPVYAGQTFVAETRFWRKINLLFGSLAAVVVLGIGAWIWYAWFGSVPHTCFSVRFDEPSYSGGSLLVGGDQIVFLHGGTLARYDLKTKKQIWSDELVTAQQIADEVKREDANRSESGSVMLPGQREKMVRVGMEQSLSLHGSGENIWVVSPGKLTHYDWNSGRVLQEITISDYGGEFTERAGEFLSFHRNTAGGQSVKHINMATGESRTEEIGVSGTAAVAQNPSRATDASAAQTTGGLPLSSSADSEKPLNPQTVAEQAQNLTLPARIALPALLANSEQQQQIANELKDEDSQNPKRTQPAPQPQPGLQDFILVPDDDGYVQFTSRLLEEHLVEHEAMKAPPQKSALDSGNVSAMNETAAVNEQLNEMQRNNGGDKIIEDQSRYQVTLRRPDSPDAGWTGEVIGPPSLFPLKTVNVLTAGKTVVVFDKSEKKLWQAELTYDISAGSAGSFQQESSYGEAPCAEQGGTLYVFDSAVLTAFDLATGEARWRIPSVGVVGLFFDDKGMLYVNTTTGNPDDIKYSRQIDVAKKIEAVLLKIDPKTGGILWSVKPGGFISYLSGKFIYTVESYDPNPTDEVELSDSLSGLQKPPFLRIMRINPKDGRVLWDYEQARCPVDVRFNENSIELVFKKEVQVLRYMTF